jgi:hypothetical protein
MTAQLFAEDAHLDHPEPEATLFLGLLDGQPALVGEDGPEVTVETASGGGVVRGPGVRPHPGARGMAVEHLFGRVAEMALIRRQLEVHERAV